MNANIRVRTSRILLKIAKNPEMAEKLLKDGGIITKQINDTKIGNEMKGERIWEL